MGTTPSRRLPPVLTAALAAVLVTGAVAAPAHASRPSARMPLTALAPSLTTALATGTTPLPPSITATWVKQVRRAPRTVLTAPADPAATEVVRLVNVERAKVSCGPVHADARLATAALLHSEDMAAHSYFSHTSLDGRTPWDRIRAQGYDYGSAENIAAGQRTPAAVMTAWMNSAGHRANILNCSNVALGVGVGTGGPYGIYWTQDFGRR